MTTQDLRVVENHVLVNQFKERCATVLTAQLMVIGAIGSHGNLAPCHVVLATKKGSEDVIHQNNNLVVRIAEALMSKSEPAKWEIVQLMATGLNGSHGPFVACPAVVALGRESECVPIQNQKMVVVSALAVMPR